MEAACSSDDPQNRSPERSPSGPLPTTTERDTRSGASRSGSNSSGVLAHADDTTVPMKPRLSPVAATTGSNDFDGNDGTPRHATPQTSPSSSASRTNQEDHENQHSHENQHARDRHGSSSSSQKKLAMPPKRIATPKEQERKLARTRSPYWSSEEESSFPRPDTSSSSSDDTEEQRIQHTKSSLAPRRTNRSNLRPTVKPQPCPQQQPLRPTNSPTTWGKLLLKRDKDDDENDNDSSVVDYEQADRFGDLPDIFFPPKERETASIRMSSADIEICQRLDLEYERALEEREIGYNARYQSVRQSAAFIILFMLAYLAGGTAFFTQEAGWAVHDALFFSIYTMTTVGYGLNDNIPDHDRFMIFIIFYIFTGIATLTIMVAQVYQCIALEATRAQHARDKAVKTIKGRDVIPRRNRRGASQTEAVSLPIATDMTMMQELDTTPHHEKCWDTCIRFYERSIVYFRDSEIGRGLSVLFPFAGLIFIGAAVVGPMEGWSVIESIYFAVVSLTTVGYGLYVPKNQIAIYFCIIWLPFSVGFMSLYLSNVASFYIRLSDRNIHRLEKQMRRRIKLAKEEAQVSRLQRGNSAYSANLGSDDNPNDDAMKKQQKQQPNGFEMLADDEEVPPLLGTSAAELGERRRNHILTHSNYSLTSGDERSTGRTMQTMRDIIKTVKHNLAVAENTVTDDESTWEDEPEDFLRAQESEFMSIRSSQEIFSPTRRSKSVQHKPTFALRVLVQERFAEIIATDIAGFQSHIEIKENTLSVTIDTLKETADKWLIPRRARKAFRAVAFEALYFVGEHGLITRGADALFDLSPFEFHGLFSPLLAAMGDAEIMEGWLATTVVLADVDLRRDGGGLQSARTTTGLTALAAPGNVIHQPTGKQATFSSGNNGKATTMSMEPMRNDQNAPSDTNDSPEKKRATIEDAVVT